MITIKDIAAQAGVSIGTVDRVLHGRGRVARETEERIRRIVIETGFRPNLHARQLSTALTHTFAVLLPQGDQDGGYWELAGPGLERAAAELSPFHVSIREYRFDRYRPESFEEAANRLLEDPPDGLVLAPVLPASAGTLLERLPPDTRYVFIDTDLSHAAPLSFIGQDPGRSGRLAAKLMRLLVREPSRVLAVRAVPEDSHIAGRISGFLSGFPAGAGPEVLVEERLEEPAACGRFMDRLLERFGLDTAGSGSADSGSTDGSRAVRNELGLFIANASCHRVAEYLEERFPEGAPVKVIGYDLTPGNRRALVRGTIEFILSQRPELQAYEALTALYRTRALGMMPPERIAMPIDILTKENVEHYR